MTARAKEGRTVRLLRGGSDGLFQSAANFVVLAGHSSAEGRERGDEKDRDEGGEQPIFDGGRARLVAEERFKGRLHSPYPR